jgi:hypothetical protein
VLVVGQFESKGMASAMPIRLTKKGDALGTAKSRALPHSWIFKLTHYWNDVRL